MSAYARLAGTLLGAAAMSAAALETAVSPLVTRTTNAVYHVRQVTRAAFPNGPAADFMLNVSRPDSNQYQDIHWIKAPDDMLVRAYGESGDTRYFFTAAPCAEAPELVREYTVTLYKLTTDFSKIDKLHPYDTASRLYQDNVRPAETAEMQAKLPWLRDRVAEIAAAAKGNPLAYARLAYAEVVTNFTYALLPPTAPLSVAKTVAERKGDCGRLSLVFVALLRAGGVPARLVACLRPIKGQEPHCWAEFYLAHYGWIPVDVTFDLGQPSFKHFGNYDDRTIVLTRGTNFKLASAGGRALTMQFCQDYGYWYWVSAEHRGAPVVTSTIEALQPTP